MSYKATVEKIKISKEKLPRVQENEVKRTSTFAFLYHPKLDINILVYLHQNTFHSKT